MADFISIHPEEWAGLIDGLYFSSMVSTVLPLFLPVVIFVIGLSLFIWIYRLEREREIQSFILWLVVSSVLLVASFKKTRVEVELSPIVLVNPQAIMNFKNVEQVSDKNTFRYSVDASGASALLSIPDKIASLFFNFLDEGFVRKVSKQTKTVPVDYLACMDPRYATATIQTLILNGVFDLSDEASQPTEVFQKKVQAFKKCYEKKFEGDSGDFLGLEISFNFSWSKFTSMLTKTAGGAASGAWAGRWFGWWGTIIGATAGGLLSLVSSASDIVDINTFTNCSTFLDVYKRKAEELADACSSKDFLPDTLSQKEKELFAKVVVACVKNPEEDKSGFCSDLKEKTLYALNEAERLSNVKNTIGRSGISGGVKDFLSEVVSDIKAWWYSITYMDYPLKFYLLAKGQGIVLALLTGVFPFIVVFSIIPTGKHFINWPLLLKATTAYFLVKLWLPMLYFVVNIAVHLFSGLSTGG
jgi:hypothetical protein